MPDLDTMLQDFASFIEEELPPPDVERVLSAAATPPAMPRRWLRPLLVAAASAMLVLAVVGLPILFLSGDESTVTEPSTTTVATTTTVASTTVAPATTPPTTVQPTPASPAEVVPFPPSELAVLDVPLSETVPGFTDTIVMSAWSDNGYSVVRWRSSEPMTELLLPPGQIGGGWPGGLDASAHWVVRLFDAGVLTVETVPTVSGERSQPEIVGQDLHGDRTPQAVWHDSEPGHLAWLECPNVRDGPTTLVTLNASDPSADPIPVRSFDQGCAGNPWWEDDSYAAEHPSVRLVRWGSTGVWVEKWSEDAEGQDVIESVLVDADGAETAMVPDAWMIATSPDGTSLWQRSDWEAPCFVVSPDGQQRSTVPGTADEDFIYQASWSPDGTRLSLWLNTDGGRRSGEEVLRIVDFESGEVIAELEEPEMSGWGNTIAWSTDNRFLLYGPDDGTNALPATIVFYDTATNTTTTIPLSAGDVDDIRVR